MTDSKHLQTLIYEKERRLQKRREQQARLGYSTPPEVLLEIEDLEADLAKLRAQLAAAPAGPPAVVDAPAASPAGARPTIFISYSHKDEAWKERLMTHLQVLALEERFAVWDDRQIAAGDDWYPAIEQAIEQASLAVLLVSVNFLTSPFIRGEEIPRLLQRRAGAGLRVYPIIVGPCPWQRVEWLSRIQVRPKNGVPLASGSDYQIDDTLAAIAMEIDDLLRV
ncbi:MAG: hypothetical protein Kow0031_00620 [Anaerolineae bacterium]